MKKNLLLVTALLLTMSMSMSAQNNNRQNGDNNRRGQQMVRTTPEERAELMTKQLDLTADQKAKVLVLLKKQDKERMEQMEKFREQFTAGTQMTDAQREEMRASRLKEVEKQNADLEKIIGKEKLAKWIELQPTRPNFNPRGGRNQ